MAVGGVVVDRDPVTPGASGVAGASVCSVRARSRRLACAALAVVRWASRHVTHWTT